MATRKQNNRRSKTQKGGANCNVANKNRIDLYKPGTAGVTAEMCAGKKGCYLPPKNCNTNDCSKIPWCYTYMKKVTVTLNDRDYPVVVSNNSTPKKVLDLVYATIQLQRQPKVMADGSVRHSGCNLNCPSKNELAKYSLVNSQGVPLDIAMSLGDNNVRSGDVLVAQKL